MQLSRLDQCLRRNNSRQMKIAQPGAAPDRKRRGSAIRGKFCGRLVSFNIMWLNTTVIALITLTFR